MLEVGMKFIISDLFRRIEKLYPTHKLLELDTIDEGKIMTIKTYYKKEHKHTIKVLKDGVLFEVIDLKEIK